MRRAGSLGKNSPWPGKQSLTKVPEEVGALLPRLKLNLLTRIPDLSAKQTEMT